MIKSLNKKFVPKWKVQSFQGNKAICVAYADSRQIMRILDESGVLWKDEYKEIGGNLFCGVSLKIDDEWITRWDCGTESKVEKEKGESSDAFKRAAVKWGVGRFLYNLGNVWVDTVEAGRSKVPVYQGQKLYGDKLSDYLNTKNGFLPINGNQLKLFHTLVSKKFSTTEKGKNWTKNFLEEREYSSTKELFLADFNFLISLLEKKPDVEKEKPSEFRSKFLNGLVETKLDKLKEEFIFETEGKKDFSSEEMESWWQKFEKAVEEKE